MGTYTYAVFGHSGDAVEAEARCRRLVEELGFSPGADYGNPQITAVAMRAEWDRGRSFSLEWIMGLLHLYPRVAALYHSEVRWWAFAQDGRMDSGLGREAVRERSRPIARCFGSDRILYVASNAGLNAAYEGGDLAALEAELRTGGSRPQAWTGPPPTDETFRDCWFLEPL